MKLKNYYRLLELFLLMLVLSYKTLAQTPSGYVCSARNDSLLTSKVYEFDIYLQNTDPVNIFELATFQAGIIINSSIINGGTIIPSIVAGSSELVTVQQPTSISFSGSPSYCIRLAPKAGPGLGTGTIIPITSPGIRVVRIRLTNSKDFGQYSPNFVFNFTPTPYNTIVSAYDQTTGLNVNITNQTFHTVSTMVNPILNATINVFNVTGGGTSPASVGLDGSQADGVNYILYKDGSPTGTTVDGTGSAISFGSQNEGEYTVKGHRKATYMYTDMTGSAIVVAACAGVTIDKQPTSTSMCEVTGNASFTVEVNGTSPFVYQWQYNTGVTWVSVANGTPSGAVYTGGTTATLGVSGITTADSYQYRCYVTNCSGGENAISNAATLTVNAIPAKPTVSLIQPTCSVGTGTITITTPTSAGMTYSIDGTTYTNTSGVFTLVAPGDYTVTAKSSAGCISPGTAVTINEQPPTPVVGNQTASISSGQTFTVTPTGVPVGTTYTWPEPIYTNGVTGGVAQTTPANNISGTLTIPSGTGTATYTVTPTAGECVGNTFTVTVTVTSTCVGVTIGIQPVNASMCAVTGNASFTVVAGGTAPFTYQWQYNTGMTWVSVVNGIPSGAKYTGGTTATLGVSGITGDGSYQYRCYVTNCSDSKNDISNTATLTVNALPAAPSVTLTQPSCSVGTGTITVTAPKEAGMTYSIDGTTYLNSTGIFSLVPPGTYTVTAKNASGCISPGTAVTINEQPPTPVVGNQTTSILSGATFTVTPTGVPVGTTYTWPAPTYTNGVTGGVAQTTPANNISGTLTIPSGTGTAIYTVTPKTGECVGNTFTVTVTVTSTCIGVTIATQPVNSSMCSITGSTSFTVATNGTSPFIFQWQYNNASTWVSVANGIPAGAVYTGGTTATLEVSGITTAGTYRYRCYVTNCSEGNNATSSIVTLTVNPTPTAPVVGKITQPTYSVPTGSVVLSGLPSGSWTITRLPDEVKTPGTGTSKTITGLPAGVFTFTVTNLYGCTSGESDEVTISTPGIPTLIINDPDVVCSPATIDLTAEEITAGSTPGLTYTYWTDPEASIEYTTPTTATTGTYYIKGTTVAGFFDIKPVNVTIFPQPIADAGPDIVLNYTFETTLEANEPGVNETGSWSIIKGTGIFEDSTYARTQVSGLSLGLNMLLWTLTNEVCPPSNSIVHVIVNDLIIPTLITPNGDQYNEYFKLNGLETLGKTELIIIDRWGAQVYKNSDYDNEWNGIDYNGNPVPDDTYFYIVKTENGKSLSGYVVVRR